VTRAYTNERGGTLPNMLHASGDSEEAKKEIALWFDDSELYSYATDSQATVHGKIPKKK
jgi:nucleoside-diphosphate kinase